MFVLGNLFTALANLTEALFTIYWWMLFIRVLLSWVNPDPFNPIVRFLVKATDPVLEPLRRIIPPIGFVDISPMIALLVLHALRIFLVRTLFDIGMKLR